MRYKIIDNGQVNVFKDTTNVFVGNGNVFNGTTNINSGNDSDRHKYKQDVQYTAEPIWRSPITMALLTWLGIIISLIEIVPFYKIIEPVITLFTEKKIKNDTHYNHMYFTLFIILMFILMMILWLKSITKRETRHPLVFNYAINGFGRKITIEKIHIKNCPKCGGKMKYYNKPVEWTEKVLTDGGSKREITKKVPAFQCERNPEHWYEVDPAEDKLK